MISSGPANAGHEDIREAGLLSREHEEHRPISVRVKYWMCLQFIRRDHDVRLVSAVCWITNKKYQFVKIIQHSHGGVLPAPREFVNRNAVAVMS